MVIPKPNPKTVKDYNEADLSGETPMPVTSGSIKNAFGKKKETPAVAPVVENTTYRSGGTPMSVLDPAPASQFVAPTPMATEQASRNVDAAGGVINQQVTGQSFSPFALGQQQAQARAEANQRASAAGQIQQAGFGGTPMAAAAGNATEAALLRNRFDNALDLEQARQQSMSQGAEAAQSYAHNINAMTAQSAANAQDARSLAQSNWTGTVLNDYGFLDAFNGAKTPGEQAEIARQYAERNPAIVRDMITAGILTPDANGQVTAQNVAAAFSNAIKGQDTMEMGWRAVESTGIFKDREEFEAVMAGEGKKMLGLTDDAKSPNNEKDAVETAKSLNRNGGLTKYLDEYGKSLTTDSPVYKELLKTSTEIEAKLTSQAAMWYAIENNLDKAPNWHNATHRDVLKSAIEDDRPVVLDGVLYSVKRRGSSNDYTFVLTNIVTGEQKDFTAY
jgi:hypothetical protein